MFSIKTTNCLKTWPTPPLGYLESTHRSAASLGFAAPSVTLRPLLGGRLIGSWPLRRRGLTVGGSPSIVIRASSLVVPYRDNARCWEGRLVRPPGTLECCPFGQSAFPKLRSLVSSLIGVLDFSKNSPQLFSVIFPPGGKTSKTLYWFDHCFNPDVCTFTRNEFHSRGMISCRAELLQSPEWFYNSAE